MIKKLTKTPLIILLIIATINIGQGLAKDNINRPVDFSQQSQQFTTGNLEKAENLYQEGQFNEAISILENAINNYEKEGEIIHQAYALRNLSLIYLQLGNWQEAENNIDRAIAVSKLINNNREQEKILNLSLEIKGELQLAIDDPEIALKTWQESSELAYKRGDISQFFKSELKQIEALQEMGFYARAVKMLAEIELKLEQANADLVTAKAWQNVGNVSRKLSKFPESELALKKGLDIAKQQKSTEAIADILISLGNLAKARNQFPQAINFYQQASKVTGNQSLQLQAYLCQLNIAVNQKSDFNLAQLISTIVATINNLPTSKNLVNQRINLGINLTKIGDDQYNQLILQQLTIANQEAAKINYQRGKANALGNLGKLYQREKQLSDARQLTEKGLLIAQQINAPDLAYQWQWQLGQILYQQKNRTAAIASYSQAVKTLSSLRSDLVAGSSDLEFNFRENVEPVYRELVSILLRPQATPDEIKQARDVIEALQIAELDNFFRDACLDVKNINLDQLEDTNTAVLYPIILADRLEVIVALPGKPLSHHSTKLPQEELEENVKEVLENMTEPQSLIGLRKRQLRLTKSALKRWYDYLIEPIRQDLQTKQLSNLVFVPDGILKSLPFAALYDGRQYLIENYSLAIAPSLQLIESKTLTQETIQLLAAGLSKQSPNNPEFTALPGVKTELQKIENIVVSADILLDQNFTEENFERQVKSFPYPIVHLATHGEFSSQAENTFLLTWDGEININELESWFKDDDLKQKYPVELLILSACRTAVGDKRAALGLAGVALRAGARSTIASLWYVSDEATQLLMTNFYQELVNNQITKAEALRRAQNSVLEKPEFDHPYYWSAFILVGNWL
jgi:CHAT domain-containing protein